MPTYVYVCDACGDDSSGKSEKPTTGDAPAKSEPASEAKSASESKPATV